MKSASRIICIAPSSELSGKRLIASESATCFSNDNGGKFSTIGARVGDVLGNGGNS